jgi:hypothetical protein
MLRMTVAEAKQIIADDDDFDSEGMLKDSIKDDYEDKYGDLSHMAYYLADDGDGEDED